jgi:prevent-host-death family protein
MGGPVTVNETLADVKANLSRFVDLVQQEHERVVITRYGQPAAVLIAAADLDALEETLTLLRDPDALRELAQAQEDWQRGAYIDLADTRDQVTRRMTGESG